MSALAGAKRVLEMDSLLYDQRFSACAGQSLKALGRFRLLPASWGSFRRTGHAERWTGNDTVLMLDLSETHSSPNGVPSTVFQSFRPFERRASTTADAADGALNS